MDDLLGDRGPVDVEGVASDAYDLGCVREVDALARGGPQGAADGAAVRAVSAAVVRGGGIAFCLDLVEDGALESRGVALDDYLELVRQSGL
ncbi:hypothetical protein EAS64_42150 [Trebonia kvetii]|uniref:Uncharacterized protein n=1 Tax=Trebonia kvetii TaxID=2480626 RepID=A0A6P2BKU6_9ACTN|nr:hypothetical protein [Trebonia kvetii]TVY99046.1 hypothetical protein EAS64_42150 [Trebonia kvetii]